MEREKLKKLSLKLTSNRENYMDSFRKNIDMYIEEKDITLREISEKADISFSTLNNLLYSDSKDCKLSTAVALARAFGVSIDELIGAETIEPLTREAIAISRNLPENARYLIRWFIKHQESLVAEHPGKRIVSVMKPICNMDGNLEQVNDFVALDISSLGNNVKPKIFIGFQLPCEHYMPHYSPYDILLVANDRHPNLIENSIFTIGGNIFIGKRKIENGIANYYSIRDGKKMWTESEIDEIIGYVALTIKSETL